MIDNSRSYLRQKFLPTSDRVKMLMTTPIASVLLRVKCSLKNPIVGKELIVCSCLLNEALDDVISMTETTASCRQSCSRYHKKKLEIGYHWISMICQSVDFSMIEQMTDQIESKSSPSSRPSEFRVPEFSLCWYSPRAGHTLDLPWLNPVHVRIHRANDLTDL